MQQTTKQMLMQLNKWNLVRLIHLHTYNRASDLIWNNSNIAKDMDHEQLQELLILKELENTGLDWELKKLGDCHQPEQFIEGHKEMLDESFQLIYSLMAEVSRLTTIENRYKLLKKEVPNETIKEIEGRLL